jgi:chaperonin GroES
VVAVGPGALGKDGKHHEMQVKEGDVVLFTTWAGDEFKDRARDEEVLVMREEDVLAVLEPK